MKSWAGNRMKRLCWGLALLALAQPVLSLDCPCDCESHREGIPASDEIAASHCHQDAEPCCRHDHEDQKSDDDCGNSECLSLLTLVEFHHCQCPSDCDCQWRHSSASPVVIRSKTADHPWRLLKPFADCPYVTRAPLPQDLPETPRQLEGQRPVSAQAACAELCRFLS